MNALPYVLASIVAFAGVFMTALGLALAQRRPPPRRAFRFLAWGPPVGLMGILALILLSLK